MSTHPLVSPLAIRLFASDRLRRDTALIKHYFARLCSIAVRAFRTDFDSVIDFHSDSYFTSGVKIKINC